MSRKRYSALTSFGTVLDERHGLAANAASRKRVKAELLGKASGCTQNACAGHEECYSSGGFSMKENGRNGCFLHEKVKVMA